MGLKDYKRHSRNITRGPRWKALRMQALERDGWACVKCGARRRLEIDHIEPVRDRPDLAWSLANLQTLCAAHHSEKTRIEVGLPPLNPKRQAWAELVRQTGRNVEQKG
ncbi:HNH endonuclease [Psychromarinibacter sp. S121]|uniref:HNH endonuclease n=1 Tax=Psychromarinibacter sp. S121 TaxID=3415127 RepID=UPI003C7DDD0C